VTERAGRGDLAWLAGLATALLGVFLWPYVVDGYRFGVGPDVPVYLWWTRVGAGEGLSQLGSRPGAPALAAALAGTLSLNAAAVTAGLASALGVAVGAAAAALVRAGGGRAGGTWWLAGLLAGIFSVHLVAGYLANLVFAVPFLAAGACLAGRRRSWWAATLLLAGGGLAHPAFLVHGTLILAGAAGMAWRAGARDEARDVALSATAGVLVAGAGVLATLAGPGPIAAETSKDGYLRRAGLDASLVDAYRDRFRLRAARYVQWVSVPLAIPGAAAADGFLRRFLSSWLVLVAVGIPLGYVTGWFPPDRLVTFGFAVPLASALGLVWLRRRLGSRPWLGRGAVVVLAGWMIAGALLAWGRQEPFISVEEGERTSKAMEYAATNTELGDPIVLLVDDRDDTATFLAARAANIALAAAPPRRARDVHVFVGTAIDFFEGRPTERPNPEYSALSRLTLAEIPEGSEPIVLVVDPFYRGRDAQVHPRLNRVAAGILASEPSSSTPVLVEQPERRSWGPSGRFGMVLGTAGILALLGALGLGYAATAFHDSVTAVAAAPAFGTAGLTLVAVALDAAGLRLQTLGVALAASALTGLGGVALLLFVKSQRDRQPAA
jgi:hypothetical protein